MLWTATLYQPLAGFELTILVIAPYIVSLFYETMQPFIIRALQLYLYGN